MNDFYISDNFKLSEFESPDTKEVKLDERLLNKLELLRSRICKPLIINSGYRTPEHNRDVGGADGSYHKKGMAVDIRKVDGMSIDEMKMYAENVGFGGIGTYNTFMHVDVREGVARWDER